MNLICTMYNIKGKHQPAVYHCIGWMESSLMTSLSIWRNIYILGGANGDGDVDSIDDNVSDEAYYKFVDDNDYVNDNDSSDDDDYERDDDNKEEEEGNNNNGNINNNGDGSIDYDTIVDDKEEDDDDNEAWYKKASQQKISCSLVLKVKK